MAGGKFMSLASVVLTAMRYDREYRADELALMTGVDLKTTQAILRMAVNSGIIESTPPEKYKRNKVFKTKQKELFLERETSSEQ